MNPYFSGWVGGRLGWCEELKKGPPKCHDLGVAKVTHVLLRTRPEEPDGSEVFGQETDQEVYFYVNALDDSDIESDDTEDDEDETMLVV